MKNVRMALIYHAMPCFRSARPIAVQRAAPFPSLTKDRPMFKKMHAVARQVSQIVVGKDLQVRQALTCLLAGGHLLVEDVPGRRQDHAGARAGHFARPQVQPGAVHQRPAAGRRRRHFGVRARDRTASCSTPGRSSPRCCWPTRSTAPRRRPSRACSKRWRSARSAPTASRARCRSRSSSSPRRTRRTRSAPSRCPNRSSTAS